jgi:hypothetical protein
MSFYGDDNDPNRSAGGQFYNHNNAGIGEQWAAGVHHGDNYSSAHAKTEMYRRANNLDLFTGVPLPPKTYGAGSGGSSYYPVHRDASQFGEVLKGLFKVLMWLVALVVVLGAIVVGALFAGRSMDAPTLASQAARGEFASYQPAPLSKFFTAKELSAPVDPAVWVAALHGLRPNKSDPRLARLRRLQGEAYRCMMQAGCRDEVARLDPKLGQLLPRAAGAYLFEPAKAGDEDATRDLCLFAVKSGTSYKDILQARDFCSSANNLNRNSKAGAQASAMLAGSWAVRRARFYGFADEVQYRGEHPSL